MNIRFVLRDSKKKDGTRKIRCYIQHNGRAYHNTKYSVREDEWNEKAGRVKENRPNAIKYNSALIKLRNEIEAVCLKHETLPAKDIVKLIGKKGIDTFISFFEKYIQECETGKYKRAIGTVKHYQVTLNSVQGFGQRTDFDTINKEWYENYTGWLRTTIGEKKAVNENTIGKHIKIIKSVLRQANEIGISMNNEYQKAYFKKPSEPTDSIYLTEEEIELWENVDLSQFEHLQAERDRFLLSYYFLLRFGDSLKLNSGNIFKQKGKFFIKMVSEKTKTESILPVSTKALKLLQKYDFKMPPTTNQESNWKLKEIAKEAKIEELVTVSGLTRSKYHFISSHTARRSGATHLYLQGFPIKDLSHLLGHKRTTQTEEYIKVSKLESAKKAMNFKFFK